MKIKVCVFATVKIACGFSEMKMEFPEKYSVSDVIQDIAASHSEIYKIKDNLLFAVNEEYCKEETKLQEGDTLAIFPPVSGG